MSNPLSNILGRLSGSDLGADATKNREITVELRTALGEAKELIGCVSEQPLKNRIGVIEKRLNRALAILDGPEVPKEGATKSGPPSKNPPPTQPTPVAIQSRVSQETIQQIKCAVADELEMRLRKILPDFRPQVGALLIDLLNESGFINQELGKTLESKLRPLQVRLEAINGAVSKIEMRGVEDTSVKASATSDSPATARSTAAGRGVPQTPESQTFKSEEKPSKREPTEREKTGLCFIKFCRESQGEYQMGYFIQLLRAKLNRTAEKVTATLVYRNAGAQETYFTDQKETNPYRGWLVAIDGEHLLLPCPVNKTKPFVNSALFEGSEGVVPETIEACLPATMRRQENRWVIVESGRLGSKMNPELPPWDEPKPQPLIPEVPISTKADVPTEMDPSKQALTPEFIGEQFVVFCRAIELGAMSPDLRQFGQLLLEKTKQKLSVGWLRYINRSPDNGASVFGIATDPQTELESAIWMIAPGGNESTEAVLLPRVVDEKRFAERDMAYIEGLGESPTSMTKIEPACVRRTENGDWIVKSPGRIKGPIGDVASVNEDEVGKVGQAFFSVCEQVARQGKPVKLEVLEDLLLEYLSTQRIPDASLEYLAFYPSETESTPEQFICVERLAATYLLIKSNSMNPAAERARKVGFYLVPIPRDRGEFVEILPRRGFYPNEESRKRTPENMAKFIPCIVRPINPDKSKFEVVRRGSLI